MSSVKKTDTNQQLARDYFLVVAQYCGGAALEKFSRYQSEIRRYPEDIVAFYQKHNSLKGIKGLKNVKNTLELILREGVVRAREIMSEKRIECIQRKPFTKDPSLDGAIREPCYEIIHSEDEVY